MAIESRNLKVGTKLVANYKGHEHHAEIVKTADGIRFVVDGGKTEFKTISGAGKSIHGSRSIGGYGFWSIAPGAAGKVKPSAKTPKPAVPKATAPSKKISKANATLASDEELKAEWDALTPAQQAEIKALESSKRTPAPKARKTATAK